MPAPLLPYRILPTARIGIEELRSYIVRTFGWETWRQTSVQIQQTIAHIRQFPESGHLPAELEGFIEDNFMQALSGKNRIIYQVRDDIVFIHLVVDTRRDLQALLHRIVLRLI
ncbi:type II toxin-antitoxin system RelE/ParE family toxin [Burkholderia sp. Ac-20365]|jgi:plasmid stabilization system protein ParE|uniref:type II toxin-antitoxin system RelE/ParE family toxin n=1 Tax=Burkholderia sp. Ac-20365 TaxID=2703897 RepID=UPI00197B6340|nr:type II toxin-antitoxin system RelE/ParE family toxin [Burkholderia sp. Ac-20365]MBN3761619.1 type II toxin-antitoxin system RelE/ParE family toxin [Burkholderia sp. Ac-20365]